MLVTEPEIISLSHRRPRAIALTRRALRSIRIGRTSFRGGAERDEDLSGFPGRRFLPRDRQKLTVCQMRSFLSDRRFESNDQPILVHINADHSLRNHPAMVRVCAAGAGLVVLGDKVLIDRSDNDVFDVGCGNAGDRRTNCGGKNSTRNLSRRLRNAISTHSNTTKQTYRHWSNFTSGWAGCVSCPRQRWSRTPSSSREGSSIPIWSLIRIFWNCGRWRTAAQSIFSAISARPAAPNSSRCADNSELRTG
jgi:hypothetical protein